MPGEAVGGDRCAVGSGSSGSGSVARSLKSDLADASPYADLTDMYDDLGEDAKPTRQKASELFRNRLRRGRPINVRRFASVLVRFDQQEEAERLLAHAVKNKHSFRE